MTTPTKKNDARDSKTSPDHREKLVEINGRLAETRLRIEQLIEAINASDAEYVRVRKQYETVVAVNIKSDARQNAEIAKLKAEKNRISADQTDLQTARENLMERRREQYELAIEALESDNMDEKARYNATMEGRTTLNTLLDDISSALNLKKTTEESQREFLYEANKNRNIRIALLTFEMEKIIGEMFETVLMSNQAERAKSVITEHYDSIQEIIKQQRQNLSEIKNLEKGLALCFDKNPST